MDAHDRQHRLSAASSKAAARPRSTGAWTSWSPRSTSSSTCKRYPYELSGGQQQTASIMRALAPEPRGAVPRRAVLGARLRDDALHPREAAGGVHADRHDDAAGVARPRGSGVPRRPGAAADQAADPGGRDPALRATRGRAPSRRCPSRASSPRRSSASRSSSARCGASVVDSPSHGRRREIEAYVDAAAAALGLPLHADHRPGVLHYFALAAELAELVEAVPLGARDEPAPAFVPIAPGDCATTRRRAMTRRAAHDAAQLLAGSAAASPTRCAPATSARAPLVQASLDAHRRHRRRVNAFTDRDRASARCARAPQLDAGWPRRDDRAPRALPLLGVPFAVKNLFDIAGLTTARRLEDRARAARRPRATRPLVARLRARRRGAGRRAQHGRVRLRLHHREQRTTARRRNPHDLTRVGRRLVGRLGRRGRRPARCR